MRVALISCCTIRYMPYIELYKSILQSLGIDFIIINEHEKEKNLSKNHFTYEIPPQKSIFNKIKKFLGWRLFVKKTLKENEIDYVVILTTWPGVKMVDFWTSKFKNKYILDIRDFSREGNKLYSRCVNRLIENSYMTVVSSEKFKTWLIDSGKISVVHNIPVEYCEQETVSLKKDDICTIGYVGLVNYEEQNRVLVDAFANKSNIILKFKGSIEKSCHIQEYCKEQAIKNVFFTGKYSNFEKKLLYDDIDMINAIYGNDSLVVTTALPNKLYDCIIYKKPIIASKGTFLGELVEDYSIGLAIDTLKDDVAEMIINYIDNFNENVFLLGCKNLLNRVTMEHNDTVEKIRKMFD